MPSVVRIHHFPHKKSAERVVCISESIGKGKLLAVRFCGSSSVDRALAFQAKGREFEPRLPLYAQPACDANGF